MTKLLKTFWTLQEDVVEFIPCFIKFWKNLNKFVMVKMINPLVNGD
jgi:hypothetical protein